MNEIQVNKSGTVYAGPKAVNLFRLKTILMGLQLERNGMRLTRKGPSALTVARKQLGLKGNRESLILQVLALIEEAGAEITVTYERE